jgi:hypothetical protein
LGVSLFMTLGGALLRAFEGSELREPRRRLQRTSSAPDALARLSTAWRASFEQVRRGQSLGLGGTPKRALGISVVVGALIVGAALLGYGLIAAAEAGEASLASFKAEYAGVEERVAVAERMRARRAAVDSSITPLRAGEAVYAITQFGSEFVADGIHKPPTRTISGSWHWIDYSPLFPDAKPLWYQAALQLAPHGFTPAQRVALEAMANNPMAPEFAVLGHAARTDVVDAALILPLPHTFLMFGLQIMNLNNLRNAARAEVAHAALELAAGQRDRAEARVRGIIGAGFALMNGRAENEVYYGGMLVGIGRSALTTLYSATGRDAEARDLESTVAEARAEYASTSPRPTGDQLELARAKMRDSRTLASLRWGNALFVLPYVPCSDLHQILFGPDERQIAAYADTRKTLVRGRVDSLLFASAEHALDEPLVFPANVKPPLGYSVTRAAARVADAALGGRRVEACTSLFWWEKAIEPAGS